MTRRAAFPPDNGTRAVEPIILPTRVRFPVPLRSGGAATIDLTGWPRKRLAAAFGVLLNESWQPLGAADRLAVRGRVAQLRRFFTFLDAIASDVRTIEEVTPDLLDRYEAWLERRGIGRIYQRHLLSTVVSLLRLLASRDPNPLSQEMTDRLSFLGHGSCGRSRPHDAYSGGVAAALRRVARAQMLAAAERVSSVCRL